jgi:prepilin-type N-terminal cleavage/methylation domain-containing protein
MRPTVKGFTLIELLVVIAIISLLKNPPSFFRVSYCYYHHIIV